MKKYERPTVKVIVLESSSILAGSADTVNDEYSNSTQLSREFDLGFEEEDNFKEEDNY